MKTAAPVRVLIVDDSPVMRQLLTHILESDPGIVVAGMACDAFEARKQLLSLKPDVMTLDIEMPRLDGLTFLDRVMSHLPTPTVIISALAPESSPNYHAAYACGASAVIDKRRIRIQEADCPHADLIRREVKAAARREAVQTREKNAPPPSTAANPELKNPEYDPSFILAIGASTGGPEALRTVVQGLPATIPPTVIVQHMPPTFTPHFAERLNQSAAFRVKEAEDGDILQAGLALLAPGDFHMEVVKTRHGQYRVQLNKDPLLHGVRPAADILMNSVAKVAGAHALGVILTGMGKDGALGLKSMRDAGAWTIGQDQATSVVYGMPKAAVDAGAVQEVLPLHRIAEVIVVRLPKKTRSRSSA